MMKVLVIGCPGSGKSTFARRLHEITGIPLIHLDTLNWKPDGTTVSRELFLQRLQDALSGASWIIDGNYGATMERRMSACDTVFFLDVPPDVSLQGVLQRRGTQRPDMPWTECAEHVDAEFLEFVRSFEENSRPEIVALLEKNSEKEIMVFRSREEANQFLSILEEDSTL